MSGRLRCSKDVRSAGWPRLMPGKNGVRPFQASGHLGRPLGRGGRESQTEAKHVVALC